MATSFFGGAFFNGEFFNTPGPTPEPDVTVTPAGSRRKRKVLIGDRLYQVNNLSDVALLLKRVVRDDPEPVVEASKARVRVVDRVEARIEQEAPPSHVIEAMDWAPLWEQLAIQDMEYAREFERVLMRMEEDDIETLLLLH